MPKLREFIQLDGMHDIQEQLKSLNYELLDALNQTNVIKELMIEKSNVLKRASDTSNMLVPEVHALNNFLCGDELEPIQPAPRPHSRKVSAGRPQRMPEIVKAAPSKRGRGRPRKTTTSVAKRPNVRAVGKKDAALDELKRNLTKLRADLQKVE
jgi:hypothetical protein